MRAAASYRQPNLKQSSTKFKEIPVRLIGESFEELKHEEQRILLNLADHEKINELTDFKQRAEQAAHDIRTPLTILSMALKHRFKSLPKEDRLLLNNIANNIKNIAQVLLDSSNKKEYREKMKEDSASVKDRNAKDHADYQHIQISERLAQIVEQKKLQYTDKNVMFDYSFDPAVGSACIYGNALNFERMMGNIINNSVEAFEGKHGIVKVSFTTDEKRAKILIEDNGKGMPVEMVKKLILGRPVSTTKKNGHGIGTRQIQDALAEFNGTQLIKSTLNIGTKIILTIPKSDKSKEGKACHDLSAADVVILDDSKSFVDTLSDFLQSNGIKKVDTYCRPDDFLKNLSQYPVNTRIITDNYFDGDTITGNILAHQLSEKGFKNICALTGLKIDVDVYLRYPMGTRIIEKGFDNIGDSVLLWCKTGR